MEPKIGIIGGSGIYDLPQLSNKKVVDVTTRFGKPSAEICVGEYGGRQIAFLPRHGRRHVLAPHQIPYRANMTALNELGVRHVFATCVCGSLKPSISPGSFVLPDQFVDLTHGRDVEDPSSGSFVHLAMGEPYCSRLQAEMRTLLQKEGCPYQERGTVVVIQGPRFSTRSEIQWFASQHWDIVNMTQYPECYIARDLGMCYSVIASVTDYAVGIKSNLNIGGAETDAIDKLFWKSAEKQKELVMLWSLSTTVGTCGCASDYRRPYFRNDDEGTTRSQ